MSQKQIALALGRSPSTVSRELSRNRNISYDLYLPEEAHVMASSRRKKRSHACKLKPTTIRWIKFKLQKQWSPEQISGRLKMEQGISISHEWIYRWILEDRNNSGQLFRNLRRFDRKKVKTRRSTTFYKKTGRPKFANVRSIETRPEVVAKRERLGDWEGDTIVAPDQESGIVSLVERVSCLARLKVTPKRHSNSVLRAIVALLAKTAGPKHTITFDRGQEFGRYDRIEKDAKIDVYFAHPYCSYERGTNENLNGLVRQYFPKGTDFKNVGAQQVQRVEWLLNHRPRKKLGYLTALTPKFVQVL